MNELLRKKVLFIGPKFFDYHKSIIEELIRQKNEVVFIPEEQNSNFEWVLSKFSIVLKDFYINKLFKRKISKIENDFDVIFVIRGRWLEHKIIMNLKILNPQAKLIMYQWDSTISNPNILKIANLFDKIFSFDRVDCEKHNHFIYLPLFFSNQKNEVTFSKKDVKYDLFFLGTNHTDRVKIIEKIKATLNNKYKIKVLIRISPIRYLIRKFIKKDILGLKRKEFVFKRISYQENLSLIMQANAVLDIEHPNQTGLTIRTIEVLAMGKKLITTNHNIIKEPFYDNRIIAIIDRQNPKIPDGFLRNKSEIIIDFSNYNISKWVSKLVD